MNKRMVRYVLSRILQIFGVLVLLPLFVSLLYQEPLRNQVSFLGTAALSSAIGFSLSRNSVSVGGMYAKEGFVIVSVCWVMLSFFGALPFVLSGEIPSLVDAFFETASGFTTTGASILNDVEVLSPSMLFWRSFTHLIGGMGVLVFALAVLPKTESESVHIMKAEVPGPVFGKLVSKLSSSARILYVIYLAMTAATILLLLIGGLPLFDSVLLSFGAAGTGGFALRNGSIAPYDSLYVETVLGFAMLAFGVNFNLYFMLLSKHVKEVFTNEELRWYLSIVAAAILLITANLVGTSQGLWTALRDSFFTVSSVVTTTGYSTADFGQWPLFSRLILLVLMFVGGMAGSTSGGIKVSRIAIMAKTAVAELKRTSYPNRVVSVHFEEKALDTKTIRSVVNYLVVYVFVFAVILLLVSLEMPDFISAFSTVAATINNIGPGMGVVGPLSSFSLYSPLNKVLLSFTMIMGRLEIFPILILFSPSIWRRRA